jgi:plastocyanin
MQHRINISILFACLGLVALCLSALGASAQAQQPPVTVQVEILKQNAGKQNTAAAPADASNVILWLVFTDETPSTAGARPPASPPPQLVQKNKSFEPHILVVQVGTTVQFPNKDPFFHNVFSLFDGKRFDLGLYEGGSTNSARFDRPGVSYLFCNIHPEMSAVILAVESPYFGRSDRLGHASIPNVPYGRYLLRVWYERSTPESLKTLERIVDISASARSLEHVQVVDSGDFKLAHKNKYGQDYAPPASPAYNHP